MLFNSFDFLLFFPIVTTLYFLIPHKFRWLHLLISSCLFYAAFIPAYILILFLIILIDYFAGLKIESSLDYRKKFYLILSITANIGILFFFKYYNFFIENINEWLYVKSDKPLPLLNIILPIGLSFHTFQAMSYTIEVYRGNQKAEKHLGIYALYVMFYPQLVAGPIERPQNLLPQFHEKKYFSYENAVSGLQLMLWGFFKKIVIADRIAWVIDPIFENPYKYSSFGLLLAAFLFSFQIFCDFSAYSDIAIGAARIMGFKLMNNFKRPYHAKSITEFWQRWHISLSTWFRNYLYIPLGGNKVSISRWYFNILIVFTLSGFWHGAKWTFIVWGLLHAFYIIFSSITLKIRTRLVDNIIQVNCLKDIISVITTFLLVMIAWIFFRSNNITEAFYIIKKVGFAYENVFEFIKTGDLINGLNIENLYKKELMWSVILILALEIVYLIDSYQGIGLLLNKFPILLRWSIYYLIFFIIIFFGFFESREFIYFQF